MYILQSQRNLLLQSLSMFAQERPVLQQSLLSMLNSAELFSDLFSDPLRTAFHYKSIVILQRTIGSFREHHVRPSRGSRKYIRSRSCSSE